nr:hypothetical protein [Morchella crassipes]
MTLWGGGRGGGKVESGGGIKIEKRAGRINGNKNQIMEQVSSYIYVYIYNETFSCPPSNHLLSKIGWKGGGRGGGQSFTLPSWKGPQHGRFHNIYMSIYIMKPWVAPSGQPRFISRPAAGNGSKILFDPSCRWAVGSAYCSNLFCPPSTSAAGLQYIYINIYIL